MGTAMHPYIKDAVFDCEATRALAIAFDDICRAMNLPREAESARANVAMRVIDLAREGLLDPKLLRARVMHEVSAMRDVIGDRPARGKSQARRAGRASLREDRMNGRHVAPSPPSLVRWSA